MFEYRVTNRDKSGTAARAGIFTTPHGAFRTPIFMPVGTYGTVKTLTPQDIESCGAEIILGNTYHLHIRPTSEVVAKMGGLHEFMQWQRPILTDSGGFQVYSLGRHVKIREDGVEFRAPLDGSRHFFSPEKVLEIQRNLGSDIAMQLDDAPPPTSDRRAIIRAVDRTARWAEQSVQWIRRRRLADRMALFPIVQGGVDRELRLQSARHAAGLGTPGIAIGGLVGGETKQQYIDLLDYTIPELPANKPRYVMGIGDPKDIVHAIARGADMMDCVLPTRLARHGGFFADDLGTTLNIKHSRFKLDKKPLTDWTHPEVAQFSRAYLRHMYMAGEPLVGRLLTLHNLTYMFRLVDRMRAAIRNNTFAQLLHEFRYSKEELSGKQACGYLSRV